MSFPSPYPDELFYSVIARYHGLEILMIIIRILTFLGIGTELCIMNFPGTYQQLRNISMVPFLLKVSSKIILFSPSILRSYLGKEKRKCIK